MSKQKIALITGINGQDGSYLTELLLDKGYIVHGLIRRSSVGNRSRINHLIEKEENKNELILHDGDLTDSSNIVRIIKEISPDEIYNLGAQSHVAVSFNSPEYTAQTDALGPLRILEAIRILGLQKRTKVYQASTSELYGLVQEIPQTEQTPFYPRSPYGVAKLYAYWITVNYRESYDIFACNGILFNHESPRRGETFVTRKITKALTRIHLSLQKYLYIGNLDSKRDWGHARDYVEMQWLMLQQEKPDDYVIATGQEASVRDFIELSAKQLNWGGIQWEGIGLDEIGRRKDNGEVVIRVNPKFFRPSEVDQLLGDPSKAYSKLGWQPKVSLKDLILEMIESDLKTGQIEKKNLEQSLKILS
ncbi:GDP-mannose 4,6-dehydratase [Prochlorococcus marinus]|uniref:GDP-mannose 4,6-dehydratase n=1 Tax=Prochlorococcus marinus TaxID=1219 RepID=UPI0022B3525E|nr:GDP-mannose 4,6-dehydratase [Prochlorococcus marinus]